MNKFRIQGISRKERHSAIDMVQHAIDKADGFLINYSMFSDIQLNFFIEMEEQKVQLFYKFLTEFCSMDDFDPPSLGSSWTKNCKVFLNMSFLKGKGDLRNTIPDVHG